MNTRHARRITNADLINDTQYIIMQTQTQPIQLSGASANAAPQRANASQAADSTQFKQALSREMEQRHSAAPAAPAKPQAAPAAQAQAPQAPAPAQAQAKPAEGKPATPSDGASTDEVRDDAADAATASPVADLLALVASFNQPAAFAPPPATAPAAVAVQAADLAGYAGVQATADADADTAALASAAKAPALPAALPAADDKAPAFKDVAQAAMSAADDKAPAFKDVAQAAIDGAARFALKAVAGEAKPKLAEATAPKSIAGTGEAPRTATSTHSLTALAGAAQARDTGAAAASQAGARAEPALAPAAPLADAAPLRARETVADIAALKDAPAAAPVMAPVQQASVAMAQAVTGAPADRIAARVGTPGWDQQVGQKIVWMVAGKEQSASLTLNPPDMGPMQVVLNVTNDQATVTFSASQPEVRQALENAMPKLREMMSESGIALGNATVNAGMPDQRQAQQGEQSRGQGSGGRFGGSAGDSAPIAAVTPRQARLDGATGLVDTFA
jgi:flagellar hook-length control protein FliK